MSCALESGTVASDLLLDTTIDQTETTTNVISKQHPMKNPHSRLNLPIKKRRIAKQSSSIKTHTASRCTEQISEGYQSHRVAATAFPFNTCQEVEACAGQRYGQQLNPMIETPSATVSVSEDCTQHKGPTGQKTSSQNFPMGRYDKNSTRQLVPFTQGPASHSGSSGITHPFPGEYNFHHGIQVGNGHRYGK